MALGSLRRGPAEMKTHFRSEDDGWTAEGCKTTAPEALEAIRRCLEEMSREEI